MNKIPVHKTAFDPGGETPPLLNPDFSAGRRIALTWNAGRPVIFYGEGSDHAAIARLRNVWRQPDGTLPAVEHLSEEELLMAITGFGNTDRSMTAISFSDSGAVLDPESPVRTLITALLTEARKRSASDIHLELDSACLRVRLRCDGVLLKGRCFDPHTGSSVISALKMLASLNIMEKRRPQEGRFSQTGGYGHCEIRVSIVPTIDGESAVLRFLENGSSPPALAELGFDKTHLSLLETIPLMPAALVLICGPTGCGKSTTAAALLSACDRTGRKVISLEDPVEYRLEDITQVRVGEEAGVSITEALPKVLRQDPDVLMIGEIRDEATCSLAVQAAMTGHLVLSTLHTANASGVKERLVELGAAPSLVGEVLQAVISQRLVRRPCACRVTGVAAQDRSAASTLLDSRTPCALCGGSGWKGRIPVAECLYRGKPWGLGLNADIQKKIAMGLTAGEEITRVYGVTP